MIKIHREGFSVRIYEDSQPHHYKSAGIQKGLILVYNSQEVSGEGIGFGAPVVKYTDKTYFSQEALLFMPNTDNITGFTKRYKVNSVFRAKFLGRHIKSSSLYKFTNYISKIHRDHAKARTIIDPILAIIRKSMGRPADLVFASDKGEIAVTYRIYDNLINITVDTSELDKNNCVEICIMNEQGADFFRKYSDSDGLIFIGNKIPSWQKVLAERARFSDIDEKMSFELMKLPNADLYLGRELFKGHLAWTGFAYCIPPSIDSFGYNIKIGNRMS